jgi:hypothetical protein
MEIQTRNQSFWYGPFNDLDHGTAAGHATKNWVSVTLLLCSAFYIHFSFSLPKVLRNDLYKIIDFPTDEPETMYRRNVSKQRNVSKYIYMENIVLMMEELRVQTLSMEV